MKKFEFNFSIRGEGIPILVIGSKLFYERTFSDSWSEYAKWIFLDHRGFSKRINEGMDLKSDYELETICNDIENFRLEKSLGKIIILGHSAHGYMAMQYASMFPNSIYGTVVLNTGPNHGNSMLLAIDRWNDLANSSRKIKYENDMKEFKIKSSQIGYNDFIDFCLSQSAKAWKNFLFDASHLWAQIHVNKLGIDYLYGEVFRDIKIETCIKEIKSPIFLGMGLHDYQVAPYYTWDDYRKYFNTLRTRIFENSSHYPYLEESEEFINELLLWVKEEIII